MKKILGIIGLVGFFTFMLWAFSYALDTDTWLSSNTATVDSINSLKNLCVGTNYLVGTTTITVGNHGVLHGICTNYGVVLSSFTIYNSSGSATNPIATVQTSTMTPCSFYDVTVSSGLTYANWGTANMTILYQCY